MLGKFSWLNPKGSYVSLEKEKQNFCVVRTYSIKRAREMFFAVRRHRCKNSLLLSSGNFATPVT